MVNENTRLMLIADSGLPNPSITVGIWTADVDPHTNPNTPKLSQVVVPLPAPYPTTPTEAQAYAAPVLAAVHTAVDAELARIDAEAAAAAQNALFSAVANGFLGTVVPHTKSTPA